MQAQHDEVDLDDPAIELAAIEAEVSRRRLQKSLQNRIPPIFNAFQRPSRYKGAHGGRGSAKSWSFAAMVILRCLKRKGTRVVCVREVQKSLGQSVKRLLEDTIKRFELKSQFRILNNYIETPGGGVIIFQGMQDHTAESIKSLEGFDIAWVEEAQALSARSLTLLRPTLRKDDSELWFTWNPRWPTDPVDVLLRSDTRPPSAIVLKVNYYDNPYLPRVLRDELEWDQRRDIEKYNHVWLGEYERNSEARVFKNWRVDDFETPAEVAFLFGGDWGFATDPTVLIRMWVDEEKRRLYIDDEVYKVGCEIDDTPALFDALGCRLEHTHDHQIDIEHRDWRRPTCQAMARQWQLVTDSARPETISFMQRHGYPRIVGAKKGPNSVKDGIEFLKNYDIYVHPRCVHTIDELTHYSFKKNPLTDQVIPVLEDKKNHVIDSLRYGIEPIRNPAVDWVTW